MKNQILTYAVKTKGALIPQMKNVLEANKKGPKGLAEDPAPTFPSRSLFMTCRKIKNDVQNVADRVVSFLQPKTPKKSI